MQAQIESVVDDTNNLISEVENHNWDQVDHLLGRRQEKLESFFQHPIKPQQSAAVANMIQYILESDKQMVNQIISERSKAIDGLSAVKDHTKAGNIYQTVARLNEHS